MLLEVLQGAIDLAVSSSTTGPEENPLAAPAPVIMPNHILSTLKAYFPSSRTARCNPSTSGCVSSSSSSSEIATKRPLLPYPLPPSSPSPTKSSTISKLGHVELSHLHSYYTTILDCSDNGIFTPVSHSESSDLIGVLEISGLVSSSVPYSAIMSPSKSGRCGFRRSPSFGALGKGSAVDQDIKIIDSVHVEEVLWGLGLGITTEGTDPREEEV
ncbi:hypothetical protein BU15DRAFT_82230 [Melanogaster broomeanus]|nr:hypothetical protein BU15DRAFT_82230 [Melanogaster broomeanus]